jgi:hypothetical protein
MNTSTETTAPLDTPREAAPSPTPWSIRPSFDPGSEKWHFGSAEVERIGLARDKETAALIVRAVNNHAALIDALQTFSRLCPTAEGLGGHAPMAAFSIAAAKARAAIAAALGE